MEDTLYLRSSSLDSWGLCQRRAAAQNNLKEVADLHPLNARTTGINSLVGSCVHLLAGVDPDTRNEDVEAWFVERQSAAMKDGEMVTMSVAVPTWEEARHQAVRCLHALDGDPLVQYFRSTETIRERKLQSQVVDGVMLTGHPDMYCPRKKILLDIKCSAASVAPKYHGQIGAYILLLEAMDYEVEQAHILWLPVRKFSQRKPKPPEPITDKYDIDYCRQHAILAIHEAKIKEKRLVDGRKRTGKLNLHNVPASPGCWACSGKWCPVHATKSCAAYYTADQVYEPPREELL